MIKSFFMVLSAPLYGEKHLSGLLMMVLLLIAYFVPLVLLRNKMSQNAKIWVLRGTILFLLLIEFIKFIILLREYGNIPMGEFPMHLCNMPLYLFPFVAFGKSKFAEYLKPASFVIGMLAGVIAIVYPSNILGGDYPWFSYEEYLFPLRSFVFHTVMIMFSGNMLLSGVYQFKHKDLARAIIVMFTLAGVAMTFNAFIPGADYFMLGMGYGNPFSFLMETSKVLYIGFMFFLAIFIVTLVYLPTEIKHYKELKALSSN